MASLRLILTFISSLLICTTSAFSGNFELTNLIVSSPFQADPTSTESTFIQFDFCDEDTPEVGQTHCCVEWAVGLSPPTSGSHSCDNTSFIVTVLSWHGVANLSLQLGHQYIDNSVGEYPYNVLTKYSTFNLTYPASEFYECNLDEAECQSCEGQTIIANVTEAIA